MTRLVRGQGFGRDLAALGAALSQPFVLGTPGRSPHTLQQPVRLKDALRDISPQLHLEVQRVHGQYPCYLLARLSRDWDAPDTVLEELFVSSSHDFFEDERFVILMRGGRSRTFLRMAPFRRRVAEQLTDAEDGPDAGRACDEILDAVASLVFEAAWDQDEQLPFRVADVLGLRRFREALELLGFVLGSDLPRVATALREGGALAMQFFRRVYVHRPMSILLRIVRRGRGRSFVSLEERARDAFAELSRAYLALLNMKGALKGLEDLELYRIVLGFYGRLEHVAAADFRTAELDAALRRVEAVAIQSMRKVLSRGRPRPVQSAHAADGGMAAGSP